MAKTPYSDAAEWFWPRKESTWLALRKPDITATDAAALFGCSPYATAFDLFHRMAGNIVVEFEESERMLWGKRLQFAIAQGVCDDRGWRIVEAHPFLYARARGIPHMGASPDYIVEDPARPDLGFGNLEIKNVDLFVAGRDWTDDEAPPHIEFQLQHQHAVTGFKWGAVAGLVGGNSPRVFVRERDDEVIAELVRRVEDMHRRVRDNDAPDPDYLKDYETIRTLYRNAVPAKSVDLDNPDGVDADSLEALIAAKYQADIAAKLAKDDQKRATAELLDTIKDTETVFGRGWKVSASTTHRAENVVTYPATSFRNCRVSKPKGRKPA